MSKVVLITGSSSGIGKASAQAFQAAGYTVYASARRTEAVTDLPGCIPLKLDVTDTDSMNHAITTIEQQHGGVDILVNNAASGLMGPVEELDIDALRDQFETNLFGLIHLTQLALPAMRRKGWGRIINISSGGGEMTFPLAGAYHASKYALEAFSDALRFEVKNFGIEVVVVQPGGVRTPLAQKTLEALKVAPGSPYTPMMQAFEQASRAGIANPRGTQSPEEVAQVILKAASASRPRTRYKIGIAKILPRLRVVLSDRAWDAMLRGQYTPRTNRA